MSRAERGGVERLTIRTLLGILAALDARLLMRVLWRGEELDRLLDEDHAAIGDYVVDALGRGAWLVVPEATFSIFGERGAIDILAYHSAFRALLVIEIKSTVPDIQNMLAGMDRKMRLAPQLARERGWAVRTVSRILVLPADRTARRRVVRHAATLDAAFPARTIQVRSWITQPDRAISGIWFVSSSQRTSTGQRVSGRQRCTKPE